MSCFVYWFCCTSDPVLDLPRRYVVEVVVESLLLADYDVIAGLEVLVCWNCSTMLNCGPCLLDVSWLMRQYV